MFFFDKDGRYKHALSPNSQLSGILYSVKGKKLDSQTGKIKLAEYPALGYEMQDETFQEILASYRNYQISSRLHRPKKNLITSTIHELRNALHLLMGCHYDLNLYGAQNKKGGEKGLLDYLFFPLLARKLIADTFIPENTKHYVTNFLSFAIALPLEALRVGLGLLLTIPLAIYLFATAPRPANKAMPQANTLSDLGPNTTTRLPTFVEESIDVSSINTDSSVKDEGNVYETPAMVMR